MLLAFSGVVLAQQTTPDRGQRSAQSTEEEGVIPGKFIVELKEDVGDPPGVADEHARRFGANVTHIYEEVLNGYAADLSDRGLSEVRADSRVKRVSPDREVEAFQSSATLSPTGYYRVNAGNGSTANTALSTPVAVIDTGIDLDHPDLSVQSESKNCVPGVSSADDDNGHGTHVAGTIAAKKNDAAGVIGVAPGTPLYAVKVLDKDGVGTWSQVICGIDWVTGKGVKVANMSLGSSGTDGTCGNSALHQAICNSTNAGVTHVVAAGNSNTNFSGKVPATYNQVLTVSAIADFDGKSGGGAAATCRSDVDDTNANFSNYAKPGTSDVNHLIAAPGVCIKSTWKNGTYNTISGTSMATPHAAGIAARCIQSGTCRDTDDDRKVEPSEVIAKLRSDAGGQPTSYGFSGNTKRKSYGKLVFAGY
jgi:subtilisin